MHRCRLASAALAIAALSFTACSDEAGAGTALDASHVHALAVDPEDPSRVYVATHEGLGAWTEQGLVRVSERPDDFMGMTVGPGGVLFGSGHPGAGVLGRSELGLITSRDGGRTWESVSLDGEADFHALTADEDGIVGYDAANGLLRSSPDGERWQDVEAPAGFLDLEAAPGSDLVYGTTGQGELLVSEDGGRTVAPVEGAPPLLLVEVFSDGDVIGVTTDGSVVLGSGGAWTPTGARAAEGLAALAVGPDDRIWLLDGDGLQRSADRGATFETLPGW